MKKLLTLNWIAILVFFVLPVAETHSQTEAEGADGLTLQHYMDSSHTAVIPAGSRIKVWTTSGTVHKGELARVTDSTFSVDGQQVARSQTSQIKLKKGEGSVIGGVVGLVLGGITMLIGLLAGFLGVRAIENAGNSSDGCSTALGGFFLLILGILLGAVGVVFFIVGLVAFAVGKAVGRSFRIPGRWRFKS